MTDYFVLFFSYLACFFGVYFALEAILFSVRLLRDLKAK